MDNGIREVEIGGVKRGFKFGPRAVAIAEREDGCIAGELFQKMAAGDQLAILNMYYGAAVDYYNIHKKPIDFTSSDVADWVHEMGYDKALTILTDGIQTYISKNQIPPVETPGVNGQSQTSSTSASEKG